MPPTLLGLFSLPPVYELILENLNLISLSRLIGTCRALRAVTPEIWNLDKLLRRYVKDFAGFRGLMREWEAAIGGSCALGFFLREHYDGSDLDVYLPNPKGVEAFCGILKKEGYEFVPFAWQAPALEDAIGERVAKKEEIQLKHHDGEYDHNDPGIMSEDTRLVYDMRKAYGVFTFEKSGEKKIQFMLTMDSAATCIIYDYYSTNIMNLITADKGYCLFAAHTILERIGHPTRDTGSNRIKAGIAKYEQRGWKIYGYKPEHSCALKCPLRAHRRVGDRFTWSIDLTPTTRKSEQVQRSIEKLEMLTFGLDFLDDPNLPGPWRFPFFHWPNYPTDKSPGENNIERGKRRGVLVRISMEVFDHPRLQEKYVVNDSYPKWRRFLVDRLDEEHEQVSLTETLTQPEPPAVSHAVTNLDFQGFLDRKVHQWYKAWEEQEAEVLNHPILQTPFRRRRLILPPS